MKAAGVYARMGWKVVPLHSALGGVCSCSRGADCPNAGKHPRVSDWVNAASSDPETIAGWAAQWPAGNVGIATGEHSGFFALDVDPSNDGPATLAELIAEHGPLPLTAEQRTGSGGSHYLFTLPDFEVANSAGKLGGGLDTRGESGQIVVAPSVSARGAYSWVHPPWSTPIAPAPEWLLAMLRRKRQSQRTAPVSDQVTYPPASPAVLDQARDALEDHGPATEGKGGDAHTFRAAAILAVDFALTELEAWPLLVEWNETCQPPWSHDDLAAKLRNGEKYGAHSYGCKRQPETLAVVFAEIDAWRASGVGQPGVTPLTQRLRRVVEGCGDPTLGAIIANEIAAAVGLTKRELHLPDVAIPINIPPGKIMIGPKLAVIADEATGAIAPHVFQRGGVLCEIADTGDRTYVSDLESNRVLDLMSRHAEWIRKANEGEIVEAQPPVNVAQILTARRMHSTPIRVLESVTTSPVFLADGSILQTKGYNESARVYLVPSVTVDVPEAPTREDARNAIRQFKALLCDFRFAGRGDFPAWLAGVLSCLVKPATRNAPAPLICVSASSPGAGKSLLTGIASRIIDGKPPEIRPYNPRDVGEWQKRVTSFVRAGTPISVFDNVNGAFGDETIDRLVTSSTWSDRVLGASEAPPVAIVTTWWATGNNIEPHGDTVRRVLVVRLEVDTERPQERTGFIYPNILRHVEQERASLLTAALTILRAYHVSGRPAQNIPTWGSFETWSDLVRGALVWCGLTDPFVTQARAAADLNEPENDAHDFWLQVIGRVEDGSPASIANEANAAGAQELLGVRDRLTPHSLRKFVARFVDRPRRGQRIRRIEGTYRVDRIAAR